MSHTSQLHLIHLMTPSSASTVRLAGRGTCRRNNPGNRSCWWFLTCWSASACSLFHRIPVHSVSASSALRTYACTISLICVYQSRSLSRWVPSMKLLVSRWLVLYKSDIVSLLWTSLQDIRNKIHVHRTSWMVDKVIQCKLDNITLSAFSQETLLMK